MREALGRHVEACFAACFPQESTGREDPGAQDFIIKATQELQEARTMRGDCRPPPYVAPHPGEDGGLRVCIHIPGLNMSQESSQESKMRRSAILRHLALSSALGAVIGECLPAGSGTVGRVVGLSRRIGGAIGWKRRLDGEELLQQSFHLDLHSYGGRCASRLLHGLKQLAEVGAEVAKMQVAEDARRS